MISLFAFGDDPSKFSFQETILRYDLIKVLNQSTMRHMSNVYRALMPHIQTSFEDLSPHFVVASQFIYFFEISLYHISALS